MHGSTLRACGRGGWQRRVAPVWQRRVAPVCACPLCGRRGGRLLCSRGLPGRAFSIVSGCCGAGGGGGALRAAKDGGSV